MEKVAFVGGYDKTDFIFYIAKILRTLGNKVLVVDGTISQKARYLIPTLTPTMMYITTSDDVDFAIGFDSIDALKQYMATDEKIEYDFVLFDIDSRKRYKGFEIMPDDKHYLVTSFDVYSLRKAVEVFKGIEIKTIITKVYFSKTKSDDEDRYLRFLTKDCNINFKKELIHIPIDINDIEAIHKNQRDNILRYKPLSTQYRNAVMYIAEDISEESSGTIKRAIRQIDR